MKLFLFSCIYLAVGILLRKINVLGQKEISYLFIIVPKLQFFLLLTVLLGGPVISVQYIPYSTTSQP